MKNFISNPIVHMVVGGILTTVGTILCAKASGDITGKEMSDSFTNNLNSAVEVEDGE